MARSVSESKGHPGWLVVIGRYSPAFIDDMKRMVPVGGRRWDPVGKLWLVHADYRTVLADVVRRHT